MAMASKLLLVATATFPSPSARCHLALPPLAPGRPFAQLHGVLPLELGLSLLRGRLQRHCPLLGVDLRQVHGQAHKQVASGTTITYEALLLQPHHLIRLRDSVAGHRDRFVAEVPPREREAEERLLEGDVQDCVEIRLCYGVGIAGAAALHLEHDTARHLPRRLVPNIRHILQCGSILCALGYSEVVDSDGHLTAFLEAFMLLLAHGHDLASEGRVCVLWHLHLFRGATPALLTLRCVWVISAATADDHAPELVRLLSHPCIELLRRNGHRNLYVIVAQFLLDLVLHARLFELLLLLLDLHLELSVLRVVLRNLVQLHVQLSLLALYLLPSSLHVLHKLHATHVIIPSIVGIPEDLIGLAQLVEDLGISALIRVVGDRQPPKLAFNSALVCIIGDIEDLVEITRDEALRGISSGHTGELEPRLLPTLASLLGHEKDLAQFRLFLVLKLLLVGFFKTLKAKLDHLQRGRVHNHKAVVRCP
mmetsp:Transcript_49503/g.105851  ORF Transcript_49503/g.105851 Transcript_49503/m.105851 type:complete len:479 (+) Transcript_49503:154-1590(+)